jgi:hypothetical protein
VTKQNTAAVAASSPTWETLEPFARQSSDASRVSTGTAAKILDQILAWSTADTISSLKRHPRTSMLGLASSGEERIVMKRDTASTPGPGGTHFTSAQD